jgi:hypothetical protein
MKKTLKEQVDRSQELIQYDNSGAKERETELTEQSWGDGPCMAVWSTICHQGEMSSFQVGQQVISPCPKVDGQWPTQALVGKKIEPDAALNGTPIMPPGFHHVTVVDSVAPNPGYPTSWTPNGHYTTNTTCNPTTTTGEQDQCQCCSSGGAISMNGLVPVGTCSSYNSSTLSNCQVSPAQGSIQCDGTSVDCTQHGVGPNVDQTTGANPGGYFDPQGVTAVVNGNCNPIQNKIAQGCPSNWSQEKCDCRMDHLNFLLTLCQSSTGGCGPNQPSQTFISSRTNHYNNQGCYGNQGSQSNPHSNSACGKKNSICPGSTPTKECKCDWLTTFTANNNCNC